MRVLIGTVLFSIFMWIERTQAFASYRLKSMARNYGNPENVGGSSHPCYRKCHAGDTRVCQYNFTLTRDTSMSYPCRDCPINMNDCFREGCITAGGIVRPVIVVNHMLPGPSIQVCEGDRIQVNVVNAFSSETATIHWHGMHQVASPYMDGTAFVTQCPIPPHNSFKYDFIASPAGTQIWHAHIGFEDSDGLFGTLVVRKPKDELQKYYDYDLAEHVMIIWHWFDSLTTNRVITPVQRRQPTPGFGFLINGLASMTEIVANKTVYKTPRKRFEVQSGKKYRFRAIFNSAVYCPVQMSIDNHTLLMIASDTGTFEPVEVDSIVLNAGERYDFVLNADQKSGNYWIRYRGLGNCDEGNVHVSEVAVLRYKGSKDVQPRGAITYDDAKRLGKVLNPVEMSSNLFSEHTVLTLMDLKGTTPNQPDISGTPNHTFYLRSSFNTYEGYFTPGPYPQLNQLSFEFPAYPFLTESDTRSSYGYCTENDDSAKQCIDGFCSCPVVYRAAKDSLVEIVFVENNTRAEPDLSGIDHPMHLHGYDFHVVAMMPLPPKITMENVIALNKAKKIPKKFHKAAVKDCISAPADSITVIRFIANNPGYWFFHCHITKHAEMGMALVLKVGEDHEMIKPPPDFPRCGPQGPRSCKRT